MNGDTLELMQAMSAMENRLADKITVIATGQAAFVGTMTTAMDAEKDARAALETNVGKEITEIKDDIKEDKRWDNARTLVAPVLVGLHMLAHKLGLKV